MTKKIFIIFFFFPLLAKTQDTPVQEIEEKIYNNQFSIGVNHNPLFYLNAMSNNFPVIFHLGYKNNFYKKYTFRTAVGLGISSDTRKCLNLGIERNIFLSKKKKATFIYGIDMVLAKDITLKYGIFIGPVVGVDVFVFKSKISLSSETGAAIGYGYSINPSKFDYGWYGYSILHRFLSININYNF